MKRLPARREHRMLDHAAAIAVVLSAAGSAQAQTLPAAPPQLPSQSDISRARVGLPPPEAAPFDFTIQSPERTAVPRAVESVDFTLSRVLVEGATVFSAGEVDRIFAGLTGHPVRLEQVRAATAVLEARYRVRGYFLTRVFIPPQRLDGGALTIRVVEGHIDRIAVDGLDRAARTQTGALLHPLTERRPIDLASTERQLLILNDLPGLTGTSVLRQSATFGASDLFVSLAKPRDYLAATVSNTNSRILGPWVYAVSGNANRPLGLPGAIAVTLSASGPGFAASQSASGRYSTAIGSSGLVGSIGAIVARARPRGSLAPLDVRNGLLSVSGRARYPVLRGRTQSLFLEGGLSLNRSDTDVLGEALVRDRDTVVDAAVIYQHNGWLRGATTVSVDLYRGLAIFGASERTSPNPSVAGFDPTFTRLTFSIQRLQRIAPRISALLTVQGQYSADKLLTGELVAFGGPGIGRGYDPSTIVGDRGAGGLAELRYDLAVPRRVFDAVQLYGFVDGARTVTLSTALSAGTVAEIGSAGAGVRATYRHFSVDLLAAKAFRQFAGTDRRGDPRVLLTATAAY